MHSDLTTWLYFFASLELFSSIAVYTDAKKITGLLLGSVLTLCTSACTESGGESPAATFSPVAAPALDPVDNLLLICIDTARADTYYELGALRQDRLTGWEESALVYTQAQASSPWTVPTLGTVFSGLLPEQHGAGYLPGLKNISMEKTLPGKMRKDIQTIAGQALKAGFSTSVFSASAWTFSPLYGGGIVDGFKDFHKFSEPGAPLDAEYWPQMVERWQGKLAEQQEGERSVHFMHFMEVHNWHLVDEPEIVKRVAAFTPEQRAEYRVTAPEPACRDQESIMCGRYMIYSHAIALVRDAVADMLSALQESGRLENTVVVLFSDHGEEFHDHIHLGRKPDKSGNDPAFGHGHSLFQELLHVPLVIWHPGLTGRRIDVPVGLVDIAPSVTSWLDIEFEATAARGRLLHEVSEARDAQRVLFSAGMFAGERQVAARDGSLKSIWYMASDRNVYFDLLKDPEEMQSISSDQVVMRFDGHFVNYDQMPRGNVLEKATTNEKHLKQLQAIGYLQGLGQADEEAGEEE